MDSIRILLFALFGLFLSLGCVAQHKFSESQLIGKWLKPIGVVPPSGKAIKEGMLLNTGGKVEFINMKSVKGDKWELKNDTLVIWSHTERMPEPQPNKFVIVRLSGSRLEMRPEKGASKRNQLYKRYK
jgi:hypothetical protein